MDMNDLVTQYIALRDKKAAMKAKFTEETSQLDAIMEKMEAVLLQKFNELGVDSIKTGSGTAYSSNRTSATVADWDSFLAYVNEHGAYELLERRCNKAAVEQHKQANDDLPPGVNWRVERVVNVRRS